MKMEYNRSTEAQIKDAKGMNLSPPSEDLSHTSPTCGIKTPLSPWHVQNMVQYTLVQRKQRTQFLPQTSAACTLQAALELHGFQRLLPTNCCTVYYTSSSLGKNMGTSQCGGSGRTHQIGTPFPCPSVAQQQNESFLFPCFLTGKLRP
jgi:hypothetical protein